MTHSLVRHLLHSQRSLQQRSPSPDRPIAEAGLGLLECLVAIMVIGITIAMITPPLYIAAGTRVQNRRAEQAYQLAQAEIDRVKVLVARGNHTTLVLPNPAGADDTLQTSTPAPSSADNSKIDSVNPACTARYTAATAVAEARRVDVDGDCEMDFLVQVFRSDGTFSDSQTALADPRPTQFRVGVRVYSFIAEDNLGNLQTEQASLQITSGQGSQYFRPLAVIFSDFYWSDRSTTLCDFHTGSGDCT